MLGKTTHTIRDEFMKIKDVNRVCIVDIEETTISQADISELNTLFTKKNLKKRVGINMKNVLHINHDFIEFISSSPAKNRVSLFNVNNDVFLILFVLKQDKNICLYLDENDFVNDSNAIFYRRLRLVKAA